MDIYGMPLRLFTCGPKVKSFMIARLLSSLLIVGTLLVGFETVGVAEEMTNSSRSITLPTDPFSFQSGAGQEIANSYCVICHSADYIYMQPEHSQKKWQTIITKMKHVFACPIPQDKIAPLAAYLFNQNQISPISRTLSQ